MLCRLAPSPSMASTRAASSIASRPTEARLATVNARAQEAKAITKTLGFAVSAVQRKRGEIMAILESDRETAGPKGACCSCTRAHRQPPAGRRGPVRSGVCRDAGCHLPAGADASQSHSREGGALQGVLRIWVRNS